MKKKITLFICAVVASLMGTAQISTFPYTENFEAESTCPTTCGSICNTLIDWNNPTTDDLDWLVDLNGTGSSNTGPTANGGADHTTGAAGGKYVYVETSCSGQGYPNKRADLESPWLDLSAQGKMNLIFWYHAYGVDQGILNIEARVGSLGVWSNIGGPVQDNQDLWQEWKGCLEAPYTGVDSVQIRFTYVSGTGLRGDIALDDITISPVSPFDVGVTAVVAPGGCGLTATEQINITLCNMGDSLIPGTMVPMTYVLDGGAPVNETITLTGGLASVCSGGCVNYTFAATADLSVNGPHTVVTWSSLAGDTVPANDSSMINTSTVPTVGGIPYFENFEAGMSGWMINNNTNGSWEFGTPADGTVITYAASGDSAFATNLTGIYNDDEDGNVVSPCIDISSATGSEVVTMKVWRSSEFSWDGANIFSSVNGGGTWNQIGAFNDPINWYNDNSIGGAPQGSQDGWTGSGVDGSSGWVCVEHTLDSTMMVNNNSLMLRVGFGTDGSVREEGFAFDDVAIGYPTLTYDYGVDSIMGVCDTLYTFDAGAGYPFYHWTDISDNYNGVWSNSQTLTVTTGGTYIITVSDAGGMCARDTVYLELLDFIRPNLIDVVNCTPGDSVLFDAQSGSIPANLMYSWSTGDTTQTSWLFAPGSISVTKTDTATGCVVSDTASFLSIPILNLGSDSSVCDSVPYILDAGTAVSYLWNDLSTNQTLSTTVDGTYYVTITDSSGCQATDSITLIFIDCSIGIKELSDGAIVTLYPNPTKGGLTLSLSKFTEDGIAIITNIYGQVVRSEKITSEITTFDLKDLSNGTYTLKLEVNDSIIVDKFIINK